MSSAVDLCAGSGGWSLAARQLGMHVLGIEIDDDACATRKAANLPTLQGDVTTLDPSQFFWARGLIGSPPCPSFSRGGKVRGSDDLLCEEGLDRLAEYGPDADLEDLRAQCQDQASMIVVEPLRWALELGPEWIALEQVPPVLHLWEKMADVLLQHDYFVWTGILNAASFGVPQIRKRAILMASKTNRDIGPPEPTHAAPDRPPWVSMADAVGWGFTKRPAPTLPATSRGGGPRVLDGGSGARQTVFKAHAAGEFIAPPTGISRTGAVRCSEADAGILQGFPADWPWAGRTQAVRHRQIGNCIPVGLARAVLRCFAEPGGLSAVGT